MPYLSVGKRLASLKELLGHAGIHRIQSKALCMFCDIDWKELTGIFFFQMRGSYLMGFEAFFTYVIVICLFFWSDFLFTIVGVVRDGRIDEIFEKKHSNSFELFVVFFLS